MSNSLFLENHMDDRDPMDGCWRLLEALEAFNHRHKDRETELGAGKLRRLNCSLSIFSAPGKEIR